MQVIFVSIDDLNPGTRYNYQLQAKYDNTDFYSNIRTFTTLEN